MKSDGGGGGDVDVEVAEVEVEGGAVVIVGVKPDEWSREVLTWSLVNVARPGDRIVALHVLDYTIEGSASLISLVRNFDTMLGVYESFCNLKQVDLKLKVVRGKSVRKVLVQEVKSCGATSLIVGSSRKHHTIRSSASVAKYCARNLAKDVSVFAVKSGKIMFRRVHNTNGSGGVHMNPPSIVFGSPKIGIEASKVGNNFSPARTSSRWRRTICSPSLQSPEYLGVDNSLALVPVETNETNSGSLESRPGWPFLRKLYCKRKSWTKVSAKQAILQWVTRLRGQNSAAVIYLDKNGRDSVFDEDCSSSVDGDDVFITRFGSEPIHSPLSPHIGSNNIPKELEGLHEKYSSACRLFTYEDLLSITSNFASENLIGEGGNSYVYRGCLPDGRELAIKILKPSLDVLKEFILEIEVITSVNHKNIVSLFGFCFENNNLMLVYDYLPRGSLEENLHGDRKDPANFGWLERYKVAVGVAEAIDYLHNGHDSEVIHRDVKSSNVLLADDFEPQLSDFGFASLASSASQHVPCGDIAGTFGYLAPEYFMHGKVTDKIDVYAYGVVLLELLSGRKPICIDNSKGQESLVLWATPILESGKYSQLLDPSLETDNNNNNEIIEKLLLAATLCIKRTPNDRPRINLVLKILQGDEEATEWGKEQMRVSEDVNAYLTNIESHINLALLDLEDDAASDSSPEASSISVEDYLKGRWSRTTSFNFN